MTRALLCSTAIASFLLAAPAFAEEAPVAADPDVAGLAGATSVDTVVVTATRSPQAVEKIGSSITVLDEQAIEASQATAIVDLLTATPGVSYTRNGGVGTTTGVNIRGAESQHTVVLIDGVKLNDPSSTQGGANFGNLLVGDVSRVEVLRGAQSTLWGSLAIGGVVNIVTAEPTRPLESTLEIEGGSRSTGYMRGGIGGKSDRLTWRLAGSWYQTEGFSAYRYGTEDDGYENGGVSGRIRFDITDSLSLDARAVYSNGKADFDGFGVDSEEYSETEELVVYTGLNFGLLDGRLKNRIGFAYTNTDRENFNPVDPVAPISFQAVGENRRWEYQGTLAISETWSATFGAESEKAEMRTRSPWTFDPNPPFVRGKAGIDSVYGQVQGEVLPGLTLTAGLRYDDHDEYGGKTLGSLAAAWVVNDGNTIVRASFGQGFRAPGLYELYSEYGNTTLEPEEFDSWDIGVEQKLLGDAVTVSATYFNRTADNEIRFFSCAFPSPDPLCSVGGVPRFGYYDNVQKTEAQGVELNGTASLGDRLVLSGNYTWTDAKNASGVNDGKRLTRRPEHMANLTATWKWTDRVSTTAAVRYVGETFNNASNTQVVDSYTLLDLRASWQLTDVFEIYGRVENATDEQYETVRDYGTAGRGAFVGLRARF